MASIPSSGNAAPTYGRRSYTAAQLCQRTNGKIKYAWSFTDTESAAYTAFLQRHPRLAAASKALPTAAELHRCVRDVAPQLEQEDDSQFVHEIVRRIASKICSTTKAATTSDHGTIAQVMDAVSTDIQSPKSDEDEDTATPLPPAPPSPLSTEELTRQQLLRTAREIRDRIHRGEWMTIRTPLNSLSDDMAAYWEASRAAQSHLTMRLLERQGPQLRLDAGLRRDLEVAGMVQPGMPC